MIRYSLYDDKKAGIRIKSPLPVSKQDNKYVFDYPCEDSSFCTDYSIELPPSLYKFELYGASGGSFTSEVSTYHYVTGECIHDSIVQQFNGNTKCESSFNYGGAGGYVSGLINVKHFTRAYVTIGGSGKYLKNTICAPVQNCYLKENMVPGGYGGGGRSSGFSGGTASGGGQTSVQFLENTLYHRVIVSGAGGGALAAAWSHKVGGQIQSTKANTWQILRLVIHLVLEKPLDWVLPKIQKVYKIPMDKLISAVVEEDGTADFQVSITMVAVGVVVHGF